MARSLKKINKAHSLRKRVKLEKQKVRKRISKHKKAHGKYPKKGYRVHIKLTPEVSEALIKYCFKNNIKPYKAVKRILTLMANQDWQPFKTELGELTSGI